MNDPQNTNSTSVLGLFPSKNNSSVDSDNEEPKVINPENVSHFELDLDNLSEMLGGIGNYEDMTDRLDYPYFKLLSDMQDKLILLESIQKENEEMEKLKREKDIQISNLKRKKSNSLQRVVEDRQQEILELLDQQIEDLETFEEDVQNIYRKFPKDWEDSEIKNLKEKVETLQADISKKMAELRREREDICRVNFDNKSMEESIGYINNLNDKLTRSVEQMTTEVNRVRSEVSSFNFVRATASSMLLSMVTARDRS